MPLIYAPEGIVGQSLNITRPHSYPRLLLGAAPVVYGWSTLALDPMGALIAQWVGFTAMWWFDLRATTAGWSEFGWGHATQRSGAYLVSESQRQSGTPSTDSICRLWSGRALSALFSQQASGARSVAMVSLVMTSTWYVLSQHCCGDERCLPVRFRRRFALSARRKHLRAEDTSLGRSKLLPHPRTPIAMWSSRSTRTAKQKVMAMANDSSEKAWS